MEPRFEVAVVLVALEGLEGKIKQKIEEASKWKTVFVETKQPSCGSAGPDHEIAGWWPGESTNDPQKIEFQAELLFIWARN